MRHYTRDELDERSRNLDVAPVLDEYEDTVLVNGLLGEYKLWTFKSDNSLKPCLTGEVGGLIGAWETWITAWHTQHLGEFDTYVDVGANCGYYALMAAMDGKNVIAVEANRNYAELLLDSAYYNGVDLDVWNVALSDESGTIDLAVPEYYHGSSSILNLDGLEEAPRVAVRAILLDELELDPLQRTLIKLDVEGAEEKVWRGAERTNSTVRPTYVIEYTPQNYSEDFFPAMEAYGTVTLVDFNGDEQPVTSGEVESRDDWATLVIRPHGER